LTTLTIAGTAKLNLSMDATTAKVTLIDGSAMTTALTVTGGTSVAQTIKGGTAADTITAGYNGDTLQGGAGGDTLSANGKSLVTLTGGAGADTFNVSTPTNNVNSYATITDLEASDKIKFGTAGTPAFKAAAIVLDPTTAVFQDYANAAIAANARGDISWFQFSGNTYIVQDQDAAQLNSFQNNSDIIVKISGLKDLSTASFNSTSATLLIV
jgi:S-layer protein